MKKYRNVFKVVELNRTFYRYPKDSTVERWRRESPIDFEFTVKAHQEITHKHRFKSDLAAEAFDKMKKICCILRARTLLFQTPASFTPDYLDDAQRFFENMDREGLNLIWETRGEKWEKPETREALCRVLRELDVPHVTDPFKVMPVYTGRLAYFRLHGSGARMYYYQYTDEELKRLHRLVKPYIDSGKDVHVFFNNLSMFEDAKRFLHFHENAEFPSVTGSVGLDSVRTVIERTRYPLTKSMLLKKLGWRIAEIRQGKQARLEEILRMLPSKSYENTDEVIDQVSKKGLS
jgi:uncharacterized protein YecE (DUF72 family)